jgi:hypothetical protein
MVTMLDADPAILTKIGTITIAPDGWIHIEGFDGDGCTCRDVSALAMVHAIGVLQRELMATLEKPGGGRVSVE